jgi:hypothetical protein
MKKLRVALLAAGFVLVFVGVAQMVIMGIHGKINPTDRRVSIGLMVAGALLAIIGRSITRRKTLLAVGMVVRWKTQEELGELFADPAYWQKCVPKLQWYGTEGRLTIHSRYMSDKWGREMVTLAKDGVVITAETVILGEKTVAFVEFDPGFFVPL